MPMFSGVEDCRGKHGEKLWNVEQLSNGMLAALVAGQNGFREMERLTEQTCAEFRRGLRSPHQLPDNIACDYAAKSPRGRLS
jgi:hypothetical protein